MNLEIFSDRTGTVENGISLNFPEARIRLNYDPKDPDCISFEDPEGHVFFTIPKKLLDSFQLGVTLFEKELKMKEQMQRCFDNNKKKVEGEGEGCEDCQGREDHPDQGNLFRVRAGVISKEDVGELLDALKDAVSEEVKAN